ncbi:LAGLIDADG family homing endonuclease [Comamonas thiooxydans]|uniref:LAGLIDADG family homing endonuclease n=1 Tax=Comamonas thiooxydans TaxID=363952 RepID=UPI0013F3B1AE
MPQWIKDAKPSVIEAFLTAAIAGDGWVQQREDHHRPSRAYATTSRLLADDMQELFIKIGNAASMRLVQPKHRPIIRGHESPAIPKLQYHVYERLASRAYLSGWRRQRQARLFRADRAIRRACVLRHGSQWHFDPAPWR